MLEILRELEPPPTNCELTWCLVQPRMKVLTVNMCMEVDNVQKRMEALGKLIQLTRPEFVALQSVTHDMVKKIVSTSWGARYNVANPPTKYETRGKPSVAILSTYPSEKSKSTTFTDTTTKKVYFRVYFVMFDRQKQQHIISLCTTQLETGLDVSDMRERQLNEALLSTLDNEDNFVVGDLSLVNEIDGKVRLMGDWKDAWVELKGEGGEAGDTLVPESNPLLSRSQLPRGRPDRILYKVSRYKLDSVDVVGQQPMAGVGVHVSSHFAVLASFSILDPTAFLPHRDQEPPACVFARPQWSLSFQQQQ